MPNCRSIVYTQRVDTGPSSRFELPKSSLLIARPVQRDRAAASSTACAAMDRGGVVAWMLVAALLLGSCTSPAACSARHLLGTYVRDAVILPPRLAARAWYDLRVADDASDAAADIGDAKPWVAGERALVVRRVLGTRLTWPPSPVSNTPRARAAPAPPQGQGQY